MAVFHVAEVVATLVEALQGVTAEEISLPRQRIDSLLANCVEGPITSCSSAIKDLILCTWEKRSLPI
jgi:hypothetical protein